MNTAGVRLINDDCEHFFQTKTTNNTGLFLPSFRSQHPHLHSLLLSPHIYPVQHPRPTDLYNSGLCIIYSVGSYWDSFFFHKHGSWQRNRPAPADHYRCHPPTPALPPPNAAPGAAAPSHTVLHYVLNFPSNLFQKDFCSFSLFFLPFLFILSFYKNCIV